MNNTPEQEEALRQQRKWRINSTYGSRNRREILYTPEEAKEAIAARKAGDYEHPLLKRIGRLSNTESRDINFINFMTETPFDKPPRVIPFYNPQLIQKFTDELTGGPVPPVRAITGP